MIVTLGTTPAIQRSMTFAKVNHDSVSRTADVRQYASGKSVNAARVLHTLGLPVVATGLAGGAILQNDLTSAGIASDFVAVDRPTRTCVTVIDRSDGSATELIEEAAAVDAAKYDELIEKYRSISADAALLAGSLPPGAPVDFYARCIASHRRPADAGTGGAPVRQGDRFVVLDASGPPLEAALSARPDVVKPNRAELAVTIGPFDDIRGAIRKLIDRGPRWAVVTDGPRPTVVSDGRSFWTVSVPEVDVVSAIGSGDSFAAGILAGIARGWPVPEACRLAAACGSANATTADAGHLDRDVVQRLFERVELRAM